LLTMDPARNQVSPVYSPDGERLAYFSNLKGAERESIWVANADGSNPVQLVQDSRINIFPQWTPGDQHLIYYSEPAGRADEYRRISVFGGAPKTILKNATDRFFDVGPDGRLLFRGAKDQVKTFDLRDNKTETLAALPGSEKWWLLRWSPDGRSIAYVVDASREDDPNAGLWVDDFKSLPRQIFRGWVVWYARGPAKEIYVVAGKPDLKGVLWKVGWRGQGLNRIPTPIPRIYSYWVTPGWNTQDYFDVSPDGRHLAFETQTVLQANIGMIENVR
jgi:Tol biopolymer transport system component